MLSNFLYFSCAALSAVRIVSHRKRCLKKNSWDAFAFAPMPGRPERSRIREPGIGLHWRRAGAHELNVPARDPRVQRAPRAGLWAEQSNIHATESKRLSLRY